MSILFLKPFGKAVGPVGAGRGCGDGASAANGSIARSGVMDRFASPKSRCDQLPIAGSSSFPRSRAPHDNVRIGASSCATVCGRAATSRLTEVTTITLPAGHRQLGGLGQVLGDKVRPARGPNRTTCHRYRCSGESQQLLPAMATFAFFTPTRFASFTPQALREDHFFGSIEKDGHYLEQLGSQKPVAPSGYLATCISFT